VLCADDPVCADLARRYGGITYGFAADAEYRATDVRAESGTLRFDVHHNGADLGEIHLPLRGVHNVQNALGVVAMALTIGVPFATAANALGRFGGVARRFDLRGRHNGATLVDDYAHLPTEIAAVLAAARNSGDAWQRVVAVFQPNRYNRMAELWPEYRDAFVDADVVVITDIFSSGTQPIPGVTGKLVVNAILDAHPRASVVWLPRRRELVDYLTHILRPGDVSISMGCGDIASLPGEVLSERLRLEVAQS
jgi:UDP-N-acetylmuramate--alanine ligase